MPLPRLPNAVVRAAAAIALLPLLACGHAAPGAEVPAPAAATATEITPADLKTRLYIYADDSMEGRLSGTVGDVKATDYIAAEAERLGLTPAGDNGSFFQTVPLVRRMVTSDSRLSVEGVPLAIWTDVLPRDQGKGARALDGVQTVFGGTVGDSSAPIISPDEAAGKLVVISAAPQPGGAPTGAVNRAAVTSQFATAAGIAVTTLDAIAASERASLREAGAQLAVSDAKPTPTFFYVTSKAASTLLGEPVAEAKPGDPGATVHGNLHFADMPAPAPARNVVAILPGTDPKLGNELVAIGAHNDHIGIQPLAEDHDSLRAWNTVMRPEGIGSSPGTPTVAQTTRIRAMLDSLRKLRPPRPDSIANGADDDGSGTVTVLEIAEAMAQGPAHPRRSVLFVWHTGEELGLLGSDWFTRHPTVTRDSIVAQLNIDMVGRGDATDIQGGGPGYLQLIGSRRLSTELGDIVERVNREGKHGFLFDYTYDADGEPHNYYCRSDHYMYARFGIPITFFTTGAHMDYHEVTDEPQYIDYAKMARVAGLIQDVALAVADLDHAVVVDKPKPDPNGGCRQ
ncbi:MAG TPA: M28 family peptidase [Gemmatimonadales bacterium]|nr:M28 family peptidase [Gemmatimonadales bacterium]